MATFRSNFRICIVVTLSLVAGFISGRVSRLVELKPAAHELLAATNETVPPQKTPAPTDEALPVPSPVGAELPTTSLVQRLKALSEMNDLLSGKFSVSIFDGQDINKDSIEIFGLTQAEAQRLRNELAAAQEQLARLEAGRAEIRPLGEGKFLVTIPPFPTEGGKVYDQLMGSIPAVLGPERYAYYQKLYHGGQSTAYGMFGLSNTVIKVQPNVDANGRPTMNTSLSTDPEMMTMSQTITFDLNFLKKYRPFIYQKMVEAGLIPPTPGS